MEQIKHSTLAVKYSQEILDTGNAQTETEHVMLPPNLTPEEDEIYADELATVLVAAARDLMEKTPDNHIEEI